MLFDSLNELGRICPRRQHRIIEDAEVQIFILDYLADSLLWLITTNYDKFVIKW